MADKSDVLHVVAAVIYDTKKEHILIAKRPDEKHQGGKWEFPGGKVEAGEAAQIALQRELYEELGVQVSVANPLIQINHQYSDKSIFLDVYEVFQFTGEAFGKEGQEVCWVKLDELATYTFPAANISILEALGLDVARLSQ
ncbi:MAG: 8-oxo-dGTP diphosphatase MutT [Thiotrichaceae bacterium]